MPLNLLENLQSRHLILGTISLSGRWTKSEGENPGVNRGRHEGGKLSRQDSQYPTPLKLVDGSDFSVLLFGLPHKTSLKELSC